MTRTGTDDPARDHEMRALIARLNCRPGDISAVNMDSSGGRSSEHPGGKPPAGGGMNGQDWWDLYLASPDRAKAMAEDALKQAHGPKERPAGETPAQELARKTKRVLELHDDGGWTTHDMARDVGLTIGQVSRIIMAATVSRRLDAGERKDAAEVMRLWHEDQGRTVRYLAAATGVPKSTVQDILRRAA